jgi:catechol 2,3-dioxygenase-like lactoylglutathione lyase family enzyme
MLGRCHIVAFVATSDLARARDFYAETLGLTALTDDPYASTFDAQGTTLRVTLVDTVTVAPYTVLGWVVPDVDTTVRALSAKGVVFERFPAMDQDDLGVWLAPSGDRVAWFKDPDGNTLSLTEGRRGKE